MNTAQPSATVEPQVPLTTGAVAPNFCLPSTADQQISLDAFRDRPVVLVFYPADWEPLSTEQLAFYQEMLSELQRLGAVLLGISVDGVWCHQAFAQAWHLA